MPTEYIIQPGDCISSIAFDNDLFPETIWNHPDNAELKKKRKDLNVLLPGDVLIIPGKVVKKVSGATEQKHRFRRKGVPAKFKTKIVLGGVPVDNEKYILIIDGVIYDGKTNDTGEIEITIPPNAKRGELTIKGEQFDIILGTIDPIEEQSGIVQRLENLGFYEEDAEEEDPYVEALRRFQESTGLEVTGEADQKTRDALVKVYGN